MEIRNILPSAFLERMRKTLKDEYDAFLASYDDKRVFGLRANPLKCVLDEFEKKVPFELEPVEWAREGFYYNDEERPGRHPLHEAGAYYIQEPSAMSAVELLDPEPGDRVLDLCAAPGGKSSQIAGRLAGEGLLVSNEIMPERSRILAQNIERMGIRNCVVTNESALKLEGRFLGFFDKILVDAPCSGEGMFRKDETAIKEWSPENVEICAERQADILDCAANMLRIGGVMVYSTCTFSETENEMNVEAFLDRHPDFKLESSQRLWPHKCKGEGHFIARMIKLNDGPVSVFRPERYLEKTGKKDRRSNGKQKARSSEELKDFLISDIGMKKDTVEKLFAGSDLVCFGDNIYLSPLPSATLSGLTVIRPGLHIVTDLGNRLEPAHALAMSIRPNETIKAVNVDYDTALKYQCGETISCDNSLKGWAVVFAEGFSTGFGKATNGTLKNHYPKGLRIKR